MTPEQEQIRQRLGANLPCQFVATDWGWGLVSTNGLWACVQESEDVFNVYQFQAIGRWASIYGVNIQEEITRVKSISLESIRASSLWTLLPEANL